MLIKNVLSSQINLKRSQQSELFFLKIVENSTNMETYDDITRKHMLTVKQMGILEGEIDITKTELKEISQELGMTDEGWNYVMQEAEKRIVLAESHLKHKSYRECLQTAQDALLLNPYILGARGLQAKAYLLLAINEEDDNFLEKAKTQAKVTLKKESQDKNALEVMSSVSSKHRLSNMDKKKNPNKKLAIILGIVIIALIGFVGVFFIANNAAAEESNSQIENVEKQLESAFEKQTSLIPKVKALLTDSDEDTKDLVNLNSLEAQIVKAEDIKELYDLHSDLGALLSGVIYRKSLENDSKTLNDLRVLLEGAENRIKTERKNYNDAILSSGLKLEKL
jgi:hypothetical protein